MCQFRKVERLCSFQQPIIFFRRFSHSHQQTYSHVYPPYIHSFLIYLFYSHLDHFFLNLLFSYHLPFHSPLFLNLHCLFSIMSGLLETLKTFMLCTLGLTFYFLTPIMYFFIVPAFGLQWYFSLFYFSSCYHHSLK